MIKEEIVQIQGREETEAISKWKEGIIDGMIGDTVAGSGGLPVSLLTKLPNYILF
jgi:hypothetical protein